MIFILTFTFMVPRRTTLLGCAHTATNARVLHMPAKCIPLQFGVYFLKAENSSIYFFCLRKGARLPVRNLCHCTNVSLRIHSNALASLVFLNVCTHTYCPLSELLNVSSRKC